MSTPSNRHSRPKKSAASEIPLLEWVISLVGLAIVSAVVVVLIHEAVAGDQSPPEVRLTVQSIASLQNGFLVKVRAENIGGEPAARVAITAELWEQSKVLEAGETQFEHLPPHSSREAGVFFQNDPRRNEIRLRAIGYEEP
ncbi:MAG: hypothetical protein V4710_04270 [Verrucomicrobiota bacterium]